jgi:hypothetical protein
MKKLPGTLGILEWLTDIRKNKSVTGDESPAIKDIAEMLLPFTRPLEEIENLSDQEIESVTKEFLKSLTADDFAELQEHAQAEFAKFTAHAVTPKKPLATTAAPTLWGRIKLAWLVFLRG